MSDVRDKVVIFEGVQYRCGSCGQPLAENPYSPTLIRCVKDKCGQKGIDLLRPDCVSAQRYIRTIEEEGNERDTR